MSEATPCYCAEPGVSGTPLILDVVPDTPRLGPDDRFTFRCDPAMDCFGHCCHDVSILLTPYDVLRMKTRSGDEFHRVHGEVRLGCVLHRQARCRWCSSRWTPETKKCQFVGEKGCAIYHHRPWACRMYPLGMAEPTGTSPVAAPILLCGEGRVVPRSRPGRRVQGSRVHRQPGSRALRRAAGSVPPVAGAVAAKKEPLTADAVRHVLHGPVRSRPLSPVRFRDPLPRTVRDRRGACWRRSVPTTKSCWIWPSTGLPSACSSKK